MNVIIRFEASEALYGGDDFNGPGRAGPLFESKQPAIIEVGPFEWVQVTYAWLRIAPDGDNIAIYDDGLWKVLGDWTVTEALGVRGDEPPYDLAALHTADMKFSDFVIAPAKEESKVHA